MNENQKKKKRKLYLSIFVSCLFTAITIEFLDILHIFFTCTEYAMANVMCEYATEEEEGETSQSHPLYDRMSPATMKSYTPYGSRSGNGGGGNESSSFYGMTSEPGRRIRRSEALLRQAAENVSRGQTFQTVSDMFQIPISTIR